MDGKKIKFISIISFLCATMLTADLAAMQRLRTVLGSPGRLVAAAGVVAGAYQLGSSLWGEYQVLHRANARVEAARVAEEGEQKRKQDQRLFDAEVERKRKENIESFSLKVYVKLPEALAKKFTLPVSRQIIDFLGSEKIIDVDELAKTWIRDDICKNGHDYRYRFIPEVSINKIREGYWYTVQCNLRFPVAKIEQSKEDNQIIVSLFNGKGTVLRLDQKGDLLNGLPLGRSFFHKGESRGQGRYSGVQEIEMPDKTPRCKMDFSDQQLLLCAEVADHDKAKGGTHIKLSTYTGREYQIKNAMLALQADHDEKQKAADEQAKLVAAPALSPADHGDHKSS